MKEVYSSLPDFSKKRRLCLTLGILLSVLSLTSILLLFFLHPRNDTYLYFVLSLGILLVWILGDYYLLFYKLGHLKAIASFLKKNNKADEINLYVFVKEEGLSYAHKLGLRKLVFLDEENKEATFLVLMESDCSFKQRQKYELAYRKDYLLGYQEKQNEAKE